MDNLERGSSGVVELDKLEQGALGAVQRDYLDPGDQRRKEFGYSNLDQCTKACTDFQAPKLQTRGYQGL